MPWTLEDVANYIDSFKLNYTATSTSLRFLNDPNLEDFLLGFGMDPGSTVRLGRKDGTYYEGLDVYASMAHFRAESGFNVEYLGHQMMAAISFIDDALNQLKLARTPQLHFLRHVRNGISHGNRFYFKYDEPKQSAYFKSFSLTKPTKAKW
jgi:hypothetical protein